MIKERGISSMTTERPKFFDSPYFVMEEDNWHLKEGAPDDVVKDFNEYMKETSLTPEISNDKPVNKSFTDTMHELLKDFSK